MICIIALVVFGVLGIFSASHRQVAKEAFDCVFRKLTLRKCQTGLDTRLKSQITGSLMRKNQKAASFVYKHFEAVSWVFTITMIVSLVYTVIGGVNFYLYGNCNGPGSDSFCIFDPLGHNSQLSQPHSEGSCPAIPPDFDALSLEGVDQRLFPSWGSGDNNVFFIGCYACPYTRESYPAIKKISEKENVRFTFGHLAVKGDTKHLTPIVHCVGEEDVSKIAPLNDFLFSLELEELGNEGLIYQKIEEFGLIAHKVQECVIADETVEAVEKMEEELTKTNIYGTPTVFINEEPVVGPKPYRVYSRMLK